MSSRGTSVISNFIVAALVGATAFAARPAVQLRSNSGITVLTNRGDSKIDGKGCEDGGRCELEVTCREVRAKDLVKPDQFGFGVGEDRDGICVERVYACRTAGKDEHEVGPVERSFSRPDGKDGADEKTYCCTRYEAEPSPAFQREMSDGPKNQVRYLCTEKRERVVRTFSKDDRCKDRCEGYIAVLDRKDVSHGQVPDGPMALSFLPTGKDRGDEYVCRQRCDFPKDGGVMPRSFDRERCERPVFYCEKTKKRPEPKKCDDRCGATTWCCRPAFDNVPTTFVPPSDGNDGFFGELVCRQVGLDGDAHDGTPVLRTYVNGEPFPDGPIDRCEPQPFCFRKCGKEIIAVPPPRVILPD